MNNNKYFFRSFSRIFVSLLATLAFLAFVQSVQADGFILNGGSPTGTITFDGDIDIWTFSANSGDTIHVQVSVSSDTNFEPRIHLKDPGGIQVDNAGGNLSATITYQAALSGTYTVEVLDNSAQTPPPGTGTYTLYLAKIPGSFIVPAGDEGGALTNGGVHAGTIELGDLDLWTFQADANDTIRAQLGKIGTTTLRPHLLLYGPDGNRIDQNDGANSATISYQATVAGTYTLVVRDGPFNVNGCGDYRLYFANIPGNYSVPAGDEGGALTNGGVHAGTIELGDLDLWTFQADALDGIAAQLDEVGTTALKPHLLLYGPDGNRIDQNDGADSASISHQATVAGTYTLVVRDGTIKASGSGDYGLTYTLTPDTTTVPAGPILATLQNGGHLSGSFDIAGNIDKYSLAVSTGDKVRLHLGDTLKINFVSPVLQVFGSDGSLVASSSDDTDARVTYRAEATETLTVVVSNSDAGIGGYDLFTAIAPQAFTTPAGDEGGVLVNNTVAVGAWTLVDIDMYTFSVINGANVSMTLEDTLNINFVSPVLQVFGSDGSLVASSNDATTAEVNFIAEATDTLFAVAFNDSRADGNYNLLATGITSLHSDSDSLNDALEIMIGSSRFDDDTDDDGVSDFDEVNYDGDATSYDPLTDLNPLAADTDGDGVDDATELANGTDPLDPGSFILLGDVNLDGQVNLGDYLKLIQFVLGTASPPSAPAITAGDLNGNSQLDTGDIVVYTRTFLGLI